MCGIKPKGGEVNQFQGTVEQWQIFHYKYFPTIKFIFFLNNLTPANLSHLNKHLTEYREKKVFFALPTTNHMKYLCFLNFLSTREYKNE